MTVKSEITRGGKKKKKKHVCQEPYTESQETQPLCLRKNVANW